MRKRGGVTAVLKELAYDEELEHVVEVLVGGILLPGLPASSHLQ